MTTPATQSSNATGRRSLPSSFFAPLHSLARYIDGPDADDVSSPSQSAEGHASGGGDVASLPDSRPGPAHDPEHDPWREWSADPAPDSAPDPEAVRGAISRLAREAQWPQTGSGTDRPLSPVDPPETAAFAEVARRVWNATVPGHAVPLGYQPAVDVTDAGERGTDRTGLDQKPPATFAPPVLPSNSPRPHGREVRVSGPAMERPRALHQRIGPGPETAPQINPRTAPQTASDAGPDSAEAHALAHDAGNLLSALRLYSELLCFSGVLDERHRHYAEDLKLLAQRSGRLIDRLLDLAVQVAAAERTAPAAQKISSDMTSVETPLPFAPGRTAPDGPGPELVERRALDGRLGAATPDAATPESASLESATPESATPEATSLAEVVMRLRGVLGTIARGALVVDLGPMAAVPVAVPVEALERVLVNLVSNAAVAVRDGGAVRVRAGVLDLPVPPETGRDASPETSRDPAVVLTVDDSGCGMSEAQVRSALGLEGPPAAPAVLGTPPARRHGLGLSIVREIVRTHGGRLFIHSRPGTGTRIEVHWPAASDRVALRPVLSPALLKVSARRSAVQSSAGMPHAALPRTGSVPAGHASIHDADQASARQSVQGAVA